MPNVVPLDSEHTPVRGLMLPRNHEAARTTTSGRVHREVEHADDDDHHTHSEQAAAPAMRLPAGPVPTWIGAILLVLVGSGGGAGVNSLVSPSVEPERVTAVEQAVAVATATTAAKHAEHGQAIAENTAEIKSIDSRTRESERDLWAEQIRTSRWMAEAIKDQSVAIGAIAEKLDVKVDLRIEPLGDGPR